MPQYRVTIVPPKAADVMHNAKGAAALGISKAQRGDWDHRAAHAADFRPHRRKPVASLVPPEPDTMTLWVKALTPKPFTHSRGRGPARRPSSRRVLRRGRARAPGREDGEPSHLDVALLGRAA